MHDKHSERNLPADERRGAYEPARRYLDDATADALSAGGTLTMAHKPSAWDWCRWCAPWLGLGLALGAITTAIVDACLS